MTEAARDALANWEVRCKSLGLLMTAPRRAILGALLQRDQAQDAVAVLQGAREHHAATSIGTVYRLLRELEQLGLVDVQAQVHERLRWRLRDPSAALPGPAPGNIRVMLQQMHRFLRELEKLGLAEMLRTSGAAVLSASHPEPAAADPTSHLLQELAGCLGYRLA